MNNLIKDQFIRDLGDLIGKKNVLTTKWSKLPYSKGWRYGEGKALAVAKPETLFEIWKIIEFCVGLDIIVIMQAANTGLTGGSTPYGDDYDRPILIINTMRISDIHIIDDGKQIVGFAGSTLIGLEKQLASYDREPHSVIGSSCIGASIVGGVCNNSGGALVKRGPAYTELSLYAQIDSSGELVLINDLGIELGDTPEEILSNLQSQNYNKDQIKFSYREIDLPKNFIILSADFKGTKNSRELIEKKQNEFIIKKKESQPNRVKTGGSTFKNSENK